MDEPNTQAVERDFVPKTSGSTKGRLLVRRGEKVLHADTLDLAESRDVTEFVRQVTKLCPGVSMEDVRKEISDVLAGELRETQTDGGAVEELDAGRIVRPELFFTPEPRPWKPFQT